METERQKLKTQYGINCSVFYEIYQYLNGSKKLFDTVKGSYKEANDYVKNLYKSHPDGAFSIRIKTDVK